MTEANPFRLSVLDLSPVGSGSTSADALRNTLDLARYVDGLGFTRYWLAEHHNLPGIASSAPEVVIGHVAGVTQHLRVGSGGVMLPNHAPLKVAETFRTLEALHPGRIDLGLGRAPGTDYRTSLALGRSPGAANEFPQLLADLQGFFSGEFPEGHPYRNVRAVPADVPPPEIWLLGSSDYSAQMAAEEGLAFAFAHHINPEPAIASLRLYRGHFHPSDSLSEPKALLAVSAVCAETDEEADVLASSADLSMLRFQQGSPLGLLPSVEEASAYPYSDFERELIRANRNRVFVGSPETLHARLARLADDAGLSEIMVTTMVHDHAARKRSYALLAGAFSVGPSQTG